MFSRNVRLLLACSLAMAVAHLFLPARSQSRPVIPVTAESSIQLNARRVDHRGAMLHVLVPESVTSHMIALSVMLENRGREVFQAGETGFLLECKVSVIGDDGKAVPYSNIGSALFVDGEGGQRATVCYPSGRIRHWEYNCAETLQSLKPGRYTLTLDAKIQFQDPATKEFLPPVIFSAKDIPFTISGDASL